MKKTLSLLLTLAMTVPLVACGSPASSSPAVPSSSGISVETVSQQPETPSQPEESSQPETSSQPEEASQPEELSQPETAAEGKALVVYFSWSGNTESVAKEIQSQTGADIFEIIPAEPYTDDYNTLLDIAQEEQRSGARPEISGSVENFDRYKTVYFGFPNWWGDMPMILYTFLDGYDFAGKTIAPFVTSGGSGFSNTISAIQSLEPDAVVADGLSLGSSAAKNPGGAVTQWLSSIGLAG